MRWIQEGKSVWSKVLFGLCLRLRLFRNVAHAFELAQAKLVVQRLGASHSHEVHRRGHSCQRSDGSGGVVTKQECFRLRTPHLDRPSVERAACHCHFASGG